MKAGFSVLDRSWIPVVTLGGEEKLLGIRQTLEGAHTLREISSASPLEEYSIYRFLGLFLMDALRPETETDIEDLLDKGCFDVERLEDYIALCESEGVSFDLFDEKRPFLQSAFDSALDREPKPVSVLDCTLPSGNNHTHFGHGRSIPSALTADAAMRLVLATYQFCTAAAQGYPSGVNAAPPYFGLIRGANLFETLAYNLLQTDTIGIELDVPPVLWRRTETIIPKREVGSTSWMQGMLFPTRRIHLISDENGVVTGVHFCQGENFCNKESWRDPYVTYRKNKDTVFPMRPSAERALWRNFCDIINIHGNQASQLLRQYCSMKEDGIAQLTLYGVETSQASYLGIYRQSLSFPISLMKNEDCIALLQLSIAAAEDLAKTLGKTMQNVEVLPDSAAQLAVRNYYRNCEARFWSMIDSESDLASKESYIRFCDDVCSYAMKAVLDALRAVNLRGAALALAEKQRDVLNKSIKKLKKEARL